jgi:hypothetical protein
MRVAARQNKGKGGAVAWIANATTCKRDEAAINYRVVSQISGGKSTEPSHLAKVDTIGKINIGQRTRNKTLKLRFQYLYNI